MSQVQLNEPSMEPPPAPAEPVDDKRRETRESPESGVIVINDRRYNIIDWSSSAVKIASFEGDPTATETLDADVEIESASERFAFHCGLRPVWFDNETGDMAAVFVMLSRESRVAIADHFDAMGKAA